MVIITREIAEKIIIGDNVIITVLDITSHHAELSIDAPRDVTVNRGEVHDRIQSSKLE